MKDEYRLVNKDEFTLREIEVVALLINGKSYKEIGILIRISPRTVEAHIRSAMSKIKCNSKKEITDFVNASGEREYFNDIFCELSKESVLLFAKNRRWLLWIFLLAGVSCLGIAAYFFCGSVEKANNVIMQSENYLDRYDYTSRIKDVISKQDKIKIAIIIGVGGSGKTTIARKFLQISQADISWEINAETGHSIFSSFVELAETLSKTKDQRSELEIIKSIVNNEEKRRLLIKFAASLLRQYKNWILLFDNVEDFSTISSYFPQNDSIWGNGILLITTRNKNLSHSSNLKRETDVNVENLSSQEQYALFCKILYGDNYANFSQKKTGEIKNFLKQIPTMPLDVSAAAYYLKNTNASFEDYIKITEKTTEDFEKIQSKLLEESINYSKTRYGIITSTFEEIIRQNRNFKELLLFICLLDSQGIPKKLLKSVADSVLVDNFIYNLRKHSLITYDDDRISIHRSTQNIGLSYFMGAVNLAVNLNEKKEMAQKFISFLTPYEYLETNYGNLEKFIPHLKSLLNKIDRLFAGNSFADGWKIDLMITTANIYRYKAYRTADALDCFQKVLELNEASKYLSQESIAAINLKIGEIYTLMSANDEAMSHLKRSVDSLSPNDFIGLAMSDRLMGIVHMRKDHFDEANKYFEKAIAELDKEKVDGVSLREMKSDIYADMSFNYFMDGINRDNAARAAEIMKKAIAIISAAAADPTANIKVAGRLAIHMSRLAGIYNALGKYDFALKTAQEAEDIIKKLPLDSDLLYAQGIVAREKGLSYLRLNKIKEAYDYFLEAKKIFSQARVGAYLFRLKMHEAESLIRLDRLDEAWKACESMFATKDRERNNYCDLFFNTCYYHAAVIKCKQNDIKSAADYFAKFFASMETLCKNILSAEKYHELIKQNAFLENPADLKTCFENSSRIFEAIYWKDYEFTKYYVEENLKLFL
ncbi:MAG: LuxR C-terminal-related transcriptional regulator [Holosporaceae bacterium]|jgi:DNA-binding CsgD family transcriptional regulator/tetratricopeptide (TPR) repeat protein|nr:LuxR C-terminal-related transcriptional regulator [Holosporaceae bacterium]